MKYKVGDVVKIASERTENMNARGMMDKYLGKTMKITRTDGRYRMAEDGGKWSWCDGDIEGLVSRCNTITIDELGRRGLKLGDLFYIEHDRIGLTGWYLVMGNEKSISLNTELKGLHGGVGVTASSYKIKRVIFQDNLANNDAHKTAEFFRSFNEDLVKSVITEVVENKKCKYIRAVHFGDPKLYTWRINDELYFTVGDVVCVDTKNGEKYVQIRELFEGKYDVSIRQVIGAAKAHKFIF